MKIYDLKRSRYKITDLLPNVDLSRKDILLRIEYADKAFSIDNVAYVILRHKYFSDIYMDISTKADIVDYGGDISSKLLATILDKKSTKPQIVRCFSNEILSFEKVGFSKIKNYGGDYARLINIKKEINIEPDSDEHIQKHIRRMRPSDLDIVSEMFKEEYPARDNVDMEYMFSLSPEVCFVFEKGKKICGAVLNQLTKGKMHLKEILVEEKERGKGIGKNLVVKSMVESKKLGTKKADVNSRDKTVGFWTALGWVPTGKWEWYLVRE